MYDVKVYIGEEMAKFECPQCHANVTKEVQEPIGCPCCGYATKGVAPYVPFTWPRVTYPWWQVPAVEPVQPWYDRIWVGDPVPNPWQTTSDGTSIDPNLGISRVTFEINNDIQSSFCVN